MTKPRVLTGTKREIADTVSRINGEVREAIVFVEEVSGAANGAASNGTPADVFAEMEPYTVRRADADDSRDAIYRRADGE